MRKGHLRPFLSEHLQSFRKCRRSPPPGFSTFSLYPAQYMEKEDAVNILQFWLAADNFQAQLAAKEGQYDGQEAQNDAMILYDK